MYEIMCRIVKLVRALRKGWIKRTDKTTVPEKPLAYLLWADDGLASDKTATGLSYIPPPKPQLPSHADSYNPPQEYLPTEVCNITLLWFACCLRLWMRPS